MEKIKYKFYAGPYATTPALNKELSEKQVQEEINKLRDCYLYELYLCDEEGSNLDGFPKGESGKLIRKIIDRNLDKASEIIIHNLSG